MRKSKVAKVILGIICMIIVLGFAFMGLVFYIFSSPFEWLNENDYQNIGQMGNEIFSLYDEGSINLGTYGFDRKDDTNLKLEKILSKYMNRINAVYIVEKDVVLISMGGLWQTVEGIAIIRNNAILQDTYNGTGFDSGTLQYSQLVPNVYRFHAGL